VLVVTKVSLVDVAAEVDVCSIVAVDGGVVAAVVVSLVVSSGLEQETIVKATMIIIKDAAVVLFIQATPVRPVVSNP
jgi:hypothetical protein